MNIWDSENFSKYEQALGSRFAAINYVSALARKRRADVHNCISESQALTWALTGIEPLDVQEYRQHLKQLEMRIPLYIQDRLCYIEDIKVRQACDTTIQESLQIGHLIYKYNNITDSCTQSRVRVIANMIWDEIRQITLDDKI